MVVTFERGFTLLDLLLLLLLILDRSIGLQDTELTRFFLHGFICKQVIKIHVSNLLPLLLCDLRIIQLNESREHLYHILSVVGLLSAGVMRKP